MRATVFGSLPGALVLALAASASAAETKHFQGLYAGVTVGTENVIAGADVLGEDVLQQDSRATGNVLAGARWQFDGGWVIGAEASFGILDGDLTIADEAGTSFIDYETDTQYAYGGYIGRAIGPERRALGYVFLSEVTRSFDVTLTTPSDTFAQSDEQGLLRFGVGGEWLIQDLARLRVMLSTSRGNYDLENTNIEPKHPFEGAVGLIIQF